MKKQEAVELLAMLENAYDWFYSEDEFKAEEKAKMWANFMRDWEYEKTKENISEHILNNKFPPKISEVKAPIKSKKRTLDDVLREEGGL